MASELKQSDAQGWSKFVTDFDKTFANWKQTYSSLSANKSWVTQNAPDMIGRYTSAMATGASDLVKLADLKVTRDAAATWLNNLQVAFSSPQAFAANFQQGVTNISDAASDAWSYLTGRFASSVKGLGIAPVVYVAVGLGVAAATIYAISQNWSSAYKLNLEIEQRKQLAAQGYTPAQIDAVQKQQNANSGGNDPFGLGAANTTIKMLVIGAAIIFVVPPLLKAMESKRG